MDEVYKTHLQFSLYTVFLFQVNQNQAFWEQVKHHKISKIKKNIKASENLRFLKIQNELSNLSKRTPR